VERANSCPICRASFNLVELMHTINGKPVPPSQFSCPILTPHRRCDLLISCRRPHSDR
jgi:hypothetical protein